MTNAILLTVVGIVLVLNLLNLVLLLGVIRRLRQHETRFEALSSADSDPSVVSVGAPLPAFFAQSVEAKPFDQEAAVGALIGFFSPSCGPCHKSLPDFVIAAKNHSGAVLAIIVEDDSDSAPMLEQLRSCATVVTESEDGPLAEAFAVSAFPSFVLVGDDRTIRASGHALPLQPV
ncbi:MAG: TlpA family protein disulfide reductase [Rhodoglobus sp.]